MLSRVSAHFLHPLMWSHTLLEAAAQTDILLCFRIVVVSTTFLNDCKENCEDNQKKARKNTFCHKTAVFCSIRDAFLISEYNVLLQTDDESHENNLLFPCLFQKTKLHLTPSLLQHLCLNCFFLFVISSAFCQQVSALKLLLLELYISPC